MVLDYRFRGIDTPDITAKKSDEVRETVVAHETAINLLVNSTVILPPNTLVRTAMSAVGGQRALATDNAGRVYHASLGDLVIGVSANAASAGGAVTILVDGVLIEGSWNWAVNTPIWLHDDGILSQTVPAIGNVVMVGWPFGQTGIRVQPQIVAVR